jgi:hypothetical protein
MLKVMFMGEMFGKYLSGTVDLDSLAHLTHPTNAPEPGTELDETDIQRPSINIERDVVMHLRYVDMLDSPLIREC